MLHINSELEKKLSNLEAGLTTEFDCSSYELTKAVIERLCIAIKDNNSKLISFKFFMSRFYVRDLLPDEMLHPYIAKILTSLSTCTNLMSLDLCMEINNDNAHLLSNILRKNPKLINICFESCTLDNQALITIFEPFEDEVFLAQCQIESINLSFNWFDKIGLQYLIKRLMNMKNLIHLNLSRNNIGDEITSEISKLIIASPNLINIDLCAARMSDPGIKNICNALSITPCIQPIYLSITRNSIGDDGFLALTQLLKNQKVKELCISTSDINDHSLFEVMCAANHNPYLLAIKCTRLTNYDTGILEKIANEFKSNSTLISLNLGQIDSSIFLDMMQHNVALQKVFNFKAVAFDDVSQACENENRKKIELHAAFNNFTAELLNQNVFPTISLYNQLRIIFDIKSLIGKKLPLSLLGLLNFYISESYALDFILSVNADTRLQYLNAISSVLNLFGTPSYQTCCNEFLTVFNPIYDAAPLRLKNYLCRLIRICREDPQNSIIFDANDMIQHNAQPVILEVPSLKDLCLDVIATQFIFADIERSHAQLALISSMLVADLVEELERVKRLLPSVQSNDQKIINNIHRMYIHGFFCTGNKGVQLIPVKASDLDDERSNNNNNEKAQQNKKSKINTANDEAILSRYFQLKRSG